MRTTTAKDFLNDCRVLWEEAELYLDEQQQFDLAEALCRMVYPKYRFSEFGRLYLDDQVFHEYYSKHVSTDNYHSYDRKYLLREVLKLIDGVPGYTAECGVYEGASSYLICQHIIGENRSHHVFDSFQGLSKPDPVDGSYWTRGVLAAAEKDVRNKLAEFSNVHYWCGWIPERFQEVENERFCFVHIDVDLYQPTSDSLRFFYPRMNDGGIMLFDDYGFKTCPGARKAIEEFFTDKAEQIIDLPTGQGLVMIGR